MTKILSKRIFSMKRYKYFKSKGFSPFLYFFPNLLKFFEIFSINIDFLYIFQDFLKTRKSILIMHANMTQYMAL